MAAEPLRELQPGEPPSVRLLLAAQDWVRAHRRPVVLAVVLVALASWLLSGLYVVRTGESAAVRRFGRLVEDAAAPGLHLALPPPFDRVTTTSTGEVSRLTIQGDFSALLDLITGDENLIETSLVVQYRVGRLGNYLFATEDARLLIEQEVRAALVEAVAATAVDDVLTSAKAAIQNQVRERTQRRLDEWNAGVSLVSVSLQSVAPPYEAAKAFREVSDARAQSAQRISTAEAEAGRIVSVARGEAARRVEQANAAAASRRLAASGDAQRFEQLRAQARLAPGQARADLWSTVVSRIFARARLIVMPPGRAPRLDLHLLDGVSVPGVVSLGQPAAPQPSVDDGGRGGGGGHER